MDREWVLNQAMDAVDHALSGKREQAAATVDGLLATGDPLVIYAAMCAWAGSTEVAIERAHDLSGDGTWTFDASVITEPSKLLVSRFFTAYGNNDPDTTEALFITAVNGGPDVLGSVISDSLSLAVMANRYMHHVIGTET